MRNNTLTDRSTLPLPRADATGDDANFGRWLTRRFENAGDAPAILKNAETVTYRQLARRCRQACAALLGWGCRPGDFAMIALGDGATSIPACVGAMSAGIVPILVDVTSFRAEYDWYFADGRPRFCLTEGALADRVAAAADRHGCTVVDRSVVEFAGPQTIAAENGRQYAPDDRDGPAFVLYTSGSTGIRKGVIHSHAAGIAACASVAERGFGFSRNDRVLCAPRLSFAFGFGFGAYLPLSVGASTILGVNPRHLDRLAEALAKLRPTVLCAVPSLLASLWRAGERWLTLDLSSLNYIVSAGERLPGWLFAAFRERYNVEVLDGLGSTELLTHVISNRRGRARSNSCGVAMPGVQIRLVDEEGSHVAMNTPGRLEVRSPSAYVGYLNRPPADPRRDGWIATGDLLCQQEDGQYVYYGRAVDTVKVNGIWVMPSEIADHLETCPDVAAAFVTTRENDAAERKVVAYVVAGDGAVIDEGSLMAYCSSLPLHMIPAAVVLMPELPLLPNGKVDRQALPAPRWRPADITRIASAGSQ